MATEFSVTLEDRPGTLADLGEALGGAGVNIRSLAGFVVEGKGLMKMVTDNDAATRSALSAAGISYSDREVLELTFDDRPGELGRFARKMADAGINIDSGFLLGSEGGKTQVAVGVDKLEEAKTLV
ncbi:MAG: ACT domain-containing protein [Anaerolineae bacterium]